MDNESRGSLDTTISHSSHATDVYQVSHNHYDVPRDVIELGGRAGDYEMWQLPQSPRDKRYTNREYENWGPAKVGTTDNNPKQGQVACAFKVVAVVLLLILLLVIAVAEVIKAVQCPRPT